MYAENSDVIYYLAVYNENYPMPVKPEGCERALWSHKVKGVKQGEGPIVRLIGSDRL